MQPVAGELAGNRGAKEVVGDGKTAVSAVGWGMLMLKRVLEVVVRIEDTLSYLRERMPLAGLSGIPAGTW